MRGVTFQAPGEVRVEDVPEPALESPDDAIVQIEASGVCGSDLHIYHGRTPVEPGFTIGHEFVGTVLAAGPEVQRAAVGDRVLGCFHTACGTCRACLRGDYHRCLHGRTFGHGSFLGNLPGAQAEQVLVPRANMALRRVPDGMGRRGRAVRGRRDGHGLSRDLACRHARRRHGRGARAGAGRAVRRAGGARLGRDAGVRGRHGRPSAWRWRAGSAPCRSISPTKTQSAWSARRPTAPGSTSPWTRWGRGPAGARDQPGARRGDRLGGGCACEQRRGAARPHLAEGLTITTGLANVIAHVDRVLAMISAGLLDPSPLVTHRMSLDDAPQAYELFDRREALKVVLAP